MSKPARLIVLLAFVVLAASVVARFGTSSSRADFLGNLGASVGPGFEIQLKLGDGTVVSSLGTGTYAIHVNDNATNHNFHLEGQGVNVATGIGEIVEADWTVDFADGYYTYHCDQHTNLSATFAVGNAPPLPAPAPAPVAAPATSIAVPPVAAAAPSSSSVPVVVATKTAKSPAAGTLKVMLGADNKLVVTRNGKAVTKLGRGTYSFVVSDKSGKQDVSVRRIGGSNSLLTGKGFTGTKTVRIDLSPGQWKLFSAANEQGIFAFFTVTKS
jgi:hypothetical protein